MRIVFLGSPDFALPTLEALAAGGHDLALVVSQPAKPVGRKGTPADPPVARRARELSLEVFQPERLRTDDARARLAGARADLFVVVAYGKILAQDVLDLPRLGCVNVHGSLLPDWRGASPVQAALLAGDVETGVSLMRMDAGMDTGPVYATARTPVAPEDDAASLSARLAAMGARLLVDSLPALERGELASAPQDEARATYCPKLTREDARVDWTRSAEEIVRRARAFTPWPGLFSERAGTRVKLTGVAAVPASEPALPGTVLEAGDAVVVACGSGALRVTTLQAEGRRALPAADFARGERLRAGERFG
jgi:methionyl-tRNA formyltransferase